MPVRNDTELIQFNGWTLRVRPAETKPARLLLLIHGWTGDENSMWVFTRDLSSAYWMIAPRAPQAAEPSGYSWRPFQPQTENRPTLEMMRSSAEGLIRLVDGYAASVAVDAGQFDLAGFSQGAVMANLLTLLYPQRVRKAAALAGFVPRGLEAVIARRPLEGKRMFITHGTLDDQVSIESARASVVLLEQAGAQVTYCEDEVGHKVSAGCMHALKSYLQD